MCICLYNTLLIDYQISGEALAQNNDEFLFLFANKKTSDCNFFLCSVFVKRLKPTTKKELFKNII